ncbi:hypothetical protein [Leptospira interrogans]|uniref:hypothetical protein n=1 Tax=Leptospira interrogans TaxID=173 RepID=UPI0003458D41
MTSIYNQSFLCVLISCVLLIGTCSKHERGHVMTKESTSEFKTNIGNRERAAGQLLSSLKLGISATEVIDMLGPPTTKTWVYTLFYSSALVIYFDDSSKLVQVTSDISPEIVTIWDESAPEISTASTQFKGKPYNRQVAAKMLLPLLKQGIPTKKVEDVLGRPDFINWRYSLTLGSSFLLVRFASDDKIVEASIRGRQ